MPPSSVLVLGSSAWFKRLGTLLWEQDGGGDRGMKRKGKSEREKRKANIGNLCKLDTGTAAAIPSFRNRRDKFSQRVALKLDS